VAATTHHGLPTARRLAAGVGVSRSGYSVVMAGKFTSEGSPMSVFLRVCIPLSYVAVVVCVVGFIERVEALGVGALIASLGGVGAILAAYNESDRMRGAKFSAQHRARYRELQSGNVFGLGRRCSPEHTQGADTSSTTRR
jgi:hypothetical protein